MNTILSTTLTAARTISADLYLTPAAGRKNREDVRADIANQYTTLTGLEFFSADHDIEIVFTVNKEARTVTHTGSLEFMFVALVNIPALSESTEVSITEEVSS